MTIRESAAYGYPFRVLLSPFIICSSYPYGTIRIISMQCSALRKNGYVCIKGRPCKIVDVSWKPFFFPGVLRQGVELEDDVADSACSPHLLFATTVWSKLEPMTSNLQSHDSILCCSNPAETEIDRINYDILLLDLSMMRRM